MSAEADVVIGAGDFASVHEGLEETIDALAAIETPTVLVPGNNETEDALREAAAGWSAATVLHGERDDDRRRRVLRPRRRHPGHALGLELRPRRRGGGGRCSPPAPRAPSSSSTRRRRATATRNGAGDALRQPGAAAGDRGEAPAARGLRPHPRVLGLREPDRRDAASATSARRAPGSRPSSRRARYLRWATPGASTTCTCSRPSPGGRARRTARVPPPSRIGTTWSCISSTRPAARYCWATSAPPPSETSLPPAAACACSSADSIPSVTKWKVVPPSISSGSRSWWVRTKTGVWKGGSSPHQPSQGSSPQGPGPPPNMLRPMMVAPTFSSASSTTWRAGVRPRRPRGRAACARPRARTPTRAAAPRLRRAGSPRSGWARRRSRRARSRSET